MTTLHHLAASGKRETPSDRVEVVVVHLELTRICLWSLRPPMTFKDTPSMLEDAALRSWSFNSLTNCPQLEGELSLTCCASSSNMSYGSFASQHGCRRRAFRLVSTTFLGPWMYWMLKTEKSRPFSPWLNLSQTDHFNARNGLANYLLLSSTTNTTCLLVMSRWDMSARESEWAIVQQMYMVDKVVGGSTVKRVVFLGKCSHSFGILVAV